MQRFWLPSPGPLRALGLALVLGACSSGDAQPFESSTTVCVAVPFETPSCPRRTSHSENAPRDCTQTKVRAILMDFAAAYSSPTGDPLRFIAEGNTFKWYSDDLRGGLGYGERGDSRLDPYKRDTLGAYLSWQRQTRSTMTINLLKFNFGRLASVTANFGMELTWGGVRYKGKGAINCTQMKIMVFSIGTPLPT